MAQNSGNKGNDNKSVLSAFSIHSHRTADTANYFIGDQNISVPVHDTDGNHLTIPNNKPPSVTLSSIIGPSNETKRQIYYFSLSLMVLCGSSTDFLGKLIYQLLPIKNNDNSGGGLSELKNSYWITWCLTFGSFLICSLAIFNSLSTFKDKNFTFKSFLKICIPAIMDLLVTGGRYLGLLFLPAAVVSILKNGLQLVFIALIRYLRGKYFGKTQLFGILLVCIGLIIVSLEDLITDSSDDNNDDNDNSDGSGNLDTILGMCIMLFVGLVGAVRNTIEEILLKEYKFHSDFIVGMESIISLICMVILAIVLIEVPYINNNLNNTQWDDIIPGFMDAMVKHGGVIECSILFLVTIYGKDIMQMRVTKLSSAMTRKLFQQFYPIGVWFVSIIMYYGVSHQFGEYWDMIYSWVRLFGFIIVLYGTCVYMIKPKTNNNDASNDNGASPNGNKGVFNKIKIIKTNQKLNDPQKITLLSPKSEHESNNNYNSLSQENIKKFNKESQQYAE